MRVKAKETSKAPVQLSLARAAVGALAIYIAFGMMAAPRLRAQSSQTYHAGKDGVGYPACANCPNPEYTDQALKARIEGIVALRAVITPEGRATNITVVKGPGYGLEEKAVEVLKRWRLKPAKRSDGTPVPVEIPVEVTFRLPTGQH